MITLMDDKFLPAIRQLRELQTLKLQEYESHLTAAEACFLEARAFDDAIAVLNKSTDKFISGDTSLHYAPAPSASAPAPRTRTVKPQSKLVGILTFIGEASSRKIEEVCTFTGLKPDTVRSQLSDYVNAGWLVRPSRGQYSLTQLGAEKCGLDLNSIKQPLLVGVFR